MRLLIIAADFGTLHFGKQLLKGLKIPEYNIFWYILNPFIIIELTGNLHFEGVLLFFLIWSLYLLHQGKWRFSAVIFALSISVKLIPLIFLPLFWQWFKKRSGFASKIEQSANKDEIASSISPHADKEWIPAYGGITKLLIFYGIIGIVTILLFLPFYSSEFISNYSGTIALWFQNFEFNASIYYLAREIGFWVYGYNQIAFLGKFFAFSTFLFVFWLALFKRHENLQNFIVLMLFALSFYYFTSTTVHPWYIATLLLLSTFTKYRFPLVWSLVIILSYLSYLNINIATKSENLWLIAIEYLIVFGALILDLKNQNIKGLLFSKKNK